MSSNQARTRHVRGFCHNEWIYFLLWFFFYIAQTSSTWHSCYLISITSMNNHKLSKSSNWTHMTLILRAFEGKDTSDLSGGSFMLHSRLPLSQNIGKVVSTCSFWRHHLLNGSERINVESSMNAYPSRSPSTSGGSRVVKQPCIQVCKNQLKRFVARRHSDRWTIKRRM